MDHKGQYYGKTYIGNIPIDIFILIVSILLIAIGVLIPFFSVFLVIGTCLLILWIAYFILVFYAERMG